MSRPSVILLAGYTAGVLLGWLLPAPLHWLWTAAAAMWLAALACRKLRAWLLWPLLLLAGWINLTDHTAILAPDDVRQLTASQPALASLRGNLLEAPRSKVSVHARGSAVRTMAVVRATQLRLGDGDWQPTVGLVLATTPGVLESNFFSGQSVEISGVIADPPPPLAAGLFDYQDYLQTRGVYRQLTAETSRDWQIGPLPRPVAPVTDRFMEWSRHTLALGLPVEDEPLHLLWAMTLGWRTAFTNGISDPFLQAGTMHLFAIDGLRIALCSGILLALTRMLQLSRAWCGAVTLPVIWFYTAATGWESSALRASIMMSIVLGAWTLKRPVDLLNSLALAALLILLGEPRQLFEASFQLSFLVMLAIALMLPPLNALADRCLQPDPLLPPVLLKGWSRVWRRAARPGSRYLALSFAAWVGSIPLSIKYFHLFSLVSTPANLVAVPLGTAALMANLGALASGAWLPALTTLFNQAAWGFMVAMTKVSALAAALPGACFYEADISWGVIAAYYAGLLLLFGGWIASSRWRWLAALTFVTVATAGLIHHQTCRAGASLTVLPLNGGQAIFAAAPRRSDDLLVDCGNAAAADSTLKDFLRAQGVNRLPRLVLTTGEERNCGGAGILDQTFKIDGLFTSAARVRSAPARQAIARFEAGPGRHHTVRPGDVIGGWTVLYPGADPGVDPGLDTAPADDRALVLARTVCGARMLLLSDLSHAGQEHLLALVPPEQLRADVVVSGLPGAGEPLEPALLAAIQPRVILIADSEYPATRRAGRALIARLARQPALVFYTRDRGAITLAPAPGGWRLTDPQGLLASSQALIGR